MAGRLLGSSVTSTDLIRLDRLTAVTQGRPDVAIGVIDGPIAMNHPDLALAHIRAISPTGEVGRSQASDHGTFVAGILCARRESAAPAICPDCTVLTRPIFADTADADVSPRATHEELAAAILDCVNAGVRLINISAALVGLSPAGERRLAEALDQARHAGVVVVAAAGNRGLVGGSALTRHRWVIPVVAYTSDGTPLPGSESSAAIGRNGLGAPGHEVTSLAPGGGYVSAGGTSAAAPFVTGTAALIWSQHPGVTGAAIRFALTSATTRPRRGVIPPMLDAWRAYQSVAVDETG